MHQYLFIQLCKQRYRYRTAGIYASKNYAKCKNSFRSIIYNSSVSVLRKAQFRFF